jgi:thymidylate synthase
MKAIQADSPLEAWAAALHYLISLQDRSTVHLAVGFTATDVLDKDAQLVSDTLKMHGHLTVEQIADTIFPYSLYRASAPDPAVLLYENWEFARRVNKRKPGRSITYFDRLTHYPGANGEFNQLDEAVNRLKRELSNRSSFRAVTEIGFAGEVDLRIMAPGTDHPRRGFPCLSHISVTVDDHKLHLAAQYRSQDFVLKALGNYLGLSRLLTFIASEVGLPTGDVFVTAAHARADVEEAGGKRRWSGVVDMLETRRAA